ncbi:MAG: hypothetical protein K0S27_1694 [Gammaproteobacteria bacterium]|nr:hypothetical protein [Gammaproteobacteria bacterium]
MGLLSRIVDFIKNNRVTDKKSRYIFYKIVDSSHEKEKLILQCVKTRAFFNSSILEIVSDKSILHGLHPVQACFIGIEYASSCKKSNFSLGAACHNKKIRSDKYEYCRYGTYKICYQDRTGNVCFSDRKTNEVFLMDPQDIALSEELIQEFDAAQAFYIGVFTGLKLNDAPMRKINLSKNNKPYLRLVE